MPRAGLSSERIVDVAVELIDADGFAALSLSAVAKRVGVAPPSLYAHIAGLEDLQRRLVERAASTLGARLLPAAAGRARGDALAALAAAYRAWALEHPGLHAALGRRFPVSGRDAPVPLAVVRAEDPASGPVLDLFLAVLDGYGLEGDAAIHAARMLRSALRGFITLEAERGFGFPVDPDASFRWMLDAMDASLTAAGTAGTP